MDNGGSVQYLTYRYRVKDKHAAQLRRMARAVDFVWNWCNETQRTAVQRGTKWPTYIDLAALAVGTNKELSLPFNTIAAVCKGYVQSRKRSGRRLLRFRGRRSLGWVPFKAPSLGKGLRFNGTNYSVWMDRPLPAEAKIKDGSSFSADARGRWYLNLVVELPLRPKRPIVNPVGIDLGLKNLVALSTGEVLAAPQFNRRASERMAMARRARKPRLVRTLHAKIQNQRRDLSHKISTGIVRRFDGVFVGNVSASKLGKTRRFARSVYDAGWYSLRRMLQYKSDYAGGTYGEVNEAWTTQRCSDCGSISGPKGRESLGVREWTCVACGSVHDRDTNAARGILRLACQSPRGASARERTGGTKPEERSL